MTIFFPSTALRVNLRASKFPLNRLGIIYPRLKKNAEFASIIRDFLEDTMAGVDSSGGDSRRWSRVKAGQRVTDLGHS